MLAIFQKSLATGKVWAYTEHESWEILKAKIIRLQDFPTGVMDTHDGSWELLRDGQIVCDEAYLWQFFSFEWGEKDDVQLFAGEFVRLADVDRE